MINPKNLIKHELIGLDVEVCESVNVNVCIHGKVVDETKNMLIIKTFGIVKKIPKKENSFIFTLPSREKVKVNGSKILARPEDRIKLKVKKW